MIEISLDHQIVIIKFYEFFHELLLIHDQWDHLLSYGMSNSFNGFFQLIRTEITGGQPGDIYEELFRGQIWQFLAIS